MNGEKWLIFLTGESQTTIRKEGNRKLPSDITVITTARKTHEWMLKSRSETLRRNRVFCCYCSVTRSCLTLCDPMDFSMPDFPVLHYLPKFAPERKLQSQKLVICISSKCLPSKPWSITVVILTHVHKFFNTPPFRDGDDSPPLNGSWAMTHFQRTINWKGKIPTWQWLLLADTTLTKWLVNTTGNKSCCYFVPQNGVMRKSLAPKCIILVPSWENLRQNQIRSLLQDTRLALSKSIQVVFFLKRKDWETHRLKEV